MTIPMTLGNSASEGNLPLEVEPEILTLSRDRKNEILSWVRKNYRRCKDQRSKQEQQWYTNLAFYFGRQNITTVTSQANGTRLYTPKAPYWRARPVINRIRPIIRKELAKMMSSAPTAYVIPASSEDKDMFAAQAGESLWNSIYEAENLSAVFRRAAFWTSITGTGFVKAFWDASKLDEVNGIPGKICFDPETPFHIFVPDLTEEDLEKQPYLIHASMRAVEEAELTYGEYLENPVRATSRSETIMDTGFLRLIGADDPPLDSVEVIEVWIKPGQFKVFPMGAMITLVGDQLAQFTSGWPYIHGMYPFGMIRHIETGSFYGESVITDLIPLQREYNRTRGQIIEAKNRMAKPQLIAPKGSVNPSSITTEPGQVILYRAGFNPPQPLPLQPLPTYVLQELERIQMDFDDISGQHEVSRGTVPPGVTAATAISFLQEQDDTMLRQTVESLEFAVQKIAKMSLTYVIQYWDTGRMIKVTGTDGSFDVVTLMGADLQNNTDIRVEKDSALPTSRAAKQAFLMDLMKMGFISPDRGLELMEVGGLNKLYDQINTDRRQAQRENLRMQQLDGETLQIYDQMAKIYDQAGGINPQTGEPAPPPPPPISPNSWDNHAVHIDAHNAFRKSQTFEALPDAIKAVFQGHVSLHEKAMQAQMGLMPSQGREIPTRIPPEEAIPSTSSIQNEGVQ